MVGVGWAALWEGLDIVGWQWRGPDVCPWCSGEMADKGGYLRCEACFLGSMPVVEKVERLRSLPYADYLATNHWREVSRAKLRLAGFRCEGCGIAINLQVHHVTYERRGFEGPDDLAVLCRACHEAAHARPITV